ncbi:hypothetical protein PY546_07430 [Providencia stuartii]|nr:hypothetical protein [Providencia stuartii]
MFLMAQHHKKFINGSLFLDITDINRIDLATDDYDGIFTVDAAKKSI